MSYSSHIENAVVDLYLNLSLKEKEDKVLVPIKEEFLDDQMLAVQEAPCYFDYVKYYLASNIVPKMTDQQRKKFFSEVKHYFWEDPILYKY